MKRSTVIALGGVGVICAVVGLVVVVILGLKWFGSTDSALTRLEYQALAVDGRTPSRQDMELFRDIVDRRMNGAGIPETSVVTEGDDRIIVRFREVGDTTTVRHLVEKTGDVAFVALGSMIVQAGQRIDLEAYPPLFSGDQIASASLADDGNMDFELQDEGAKLFADYTSKHVAEYFAIVLDGFVISAPIIQAAIPGGMIRISPGGLGESKSTAADDLVTTLKRALMPFPLRKVPTE